MLIISGPGKSGTSYLYQLLRLIKQFDCGVIKEPSYFSLYYHKGFNWYEHLYTQKNAIKTDCSNSYFADQAAPYRINQDLNNPKIISIYRDPRDRLISHLIYLKRSGYKIDLFSNLGIEIALNNHNVLMRTLNYSENAKRWAELFGSNFRIIKIDDLNKKPKEIIKDICLLNNINLKDMINYINFDDVDRNESEDSLSPILSTLGRKTFNMMRRYNMHRIIQKIKDTGIKKVFLKKANSSDKSKIILPNWIEEKINKEREIILLSLKQKDNLFEYHG